MSSSYEGDNFNHRVFERRASVLPIFLAPYGQCRPLLGNCIILGPFQVLIKQFFFLFDA